MFNKNKPETQQGNTYSTPTPAPVEQRPEPVVPAVPTYQAPPPQVAPSPLASAATARAETPNSMLKPSIISEGFELVGDLTAPNGTVHIEGTVKGKLTLSAVTIGAKGILEGNVACSSLQIKGKFTGHAMCDDLVVANTATVSGTVHYQSLTAQRGALINGDLVKK